MPLLVSTMQRFSKKGLLLSGFFLFAMFMGAGPGLYIVAVRPVTLGPFPAFYLWTISWFFVLAGIVVYASATLWSKEDEED